MTRRPADLFGRPAAQSVRLIALGYLDEAAGALDRLKQPEDTEALHDFRVALRRLRTTLRAYRPLLERSIPRRLRRRLRDVADGTSPARDAEVALAWLRPLSTEFSARERVGLHWLIERIELRQAKDLPGTLAGARRAFTGVERKLRKELGVYRRRVTVRGAAPEERFAAVATGTLRDQAKRLEQAIAMVTAPDDEPIHRARIAAKRLRYQLEPLAEALDGGPPLVRRLKHLQDVLGELHDLLELEDVVRQALEAAAVARADRLWELALDDVPARNALRAAQRRRQNPGLLAVAQRCRARRAALFAQLQIEWLGNTEAWTDDVAAAIEPLVAPRSVTPARPQPRRAAPRWARRTPSA